MTRASKKVDPGKRPYCLAGIPFKNVTVAQADLILRHIAEGASDKELAANARAYGLSPRKMREFIVRNKIHGAAPPPSPPPAAPAVAASAKAERVA